MRNFLSIINQKEVVSVVRPPKEKASSRFSMLGGALGGGALLVLDNALSSDDSRSEEQRLSLPDLVVEAIDSISLRLSQLRQSNQEAMEELQAK